MKLIVYALMFIVPFIWAQEITQAHHSQAEINCKECHNCGVPTFKTPCLTLFPDFVRGGISLDQSAEKAPELVVIDKLVDQYQPSVFTHRLHSEMAEISGGCISCHHFNPPGKVKSCQDCHGQASFSGLNKPGLRGAYHRLCLNCHREWSHSTDCIVCHDLKGSEPQDKSKFVGKHHEKLEIPKKIVYETDEDDNPLVTFYHDDHALVFGLKCAECHVNESCSRCHDQTGINKVPKKAPGYEAHDNCINCHEEAIDDACDKCHDTVERKPFDHLTKGWKLNRFHRELKCLNCHSDKVYKSRSTKCTSCHKSWEDGDFEHSVTGVLLDETHSEFECLDCHHDSEFEKPPSCLDCHDDYAYPNEIPGTQLKR